ncbi:MAG TPA: glycosyltransferase family 2 protein [Polyangiaceae bacterium]
MDQSLTGLETSRSSRVTVVVPTFREAENLPHLIERLERVRDQSNLELDLLIMDDNSQDGSVEWIAAHPRAWVQIVVRHQDRGLSPSVLDGMARATGDVLVCMDADLSHPPEAIPQMLNKLEEGSDFVIGSRYIKGGSTSDDWGFMRWLNSRVATLLARPLTSARDPMAGFFAFRRATLQAGQDFNPVGYKIGLEFVVKCGCERVVEVPIHFEDRQLGKSKLTMRQQLLYIKHLRRLYTFKFGAWSQLVQFLTVGGLGTIVNLLLLTLLLRMGASLKPAVAVAIVLSMLFNFVLNRRFSFGETRRESWLKQFVGFMTACSIGAVMNYFVTLLFANTFALQAQVAALIGIAAATLFNFIASRYLVFRSSHIRPARPRT